MIQNPKEQVQSEQPQPPESYKIRLPDKPLTPEEKHVYPYGKFQSALKTHMLSMWSCFLRLYLSMLLKSRWRNHEIGEMPATFCGG